MAVIASRPSTPESRKRYTETFGEDRLSRHRWLEEAKPDETYAEWVARVAAEEKRWGVEP